MCTEVKHYRCERRLLIPIVRKEFVSIAVRFFWPVDFPISLAAEFLFL